MKTAFPSTASIAEASRLTVLRLQSQLTDAQKEVSTGRYADVGQTLGASTAQTVSLRQEQTRLQAMMDSNGLVSTRLDSTQAALNSIGQDAQSFLDQLAGANNGNVQSLLQSEAKTSLSALVGTLNTQVNGAYIFAGINADVKPVAAYDQSPPGANQQAVADAFSATFGFSQSDPQVANISASDMQNFLDTSFSDMFTESGWKSTWSSASDQNVRSRISNSELIDTSASANADPMRKLASAYTMLADLGTANLSSVAFQAVVKKASTLTAEAIQGLADVQANLGSAQQRVTAANSGMTIQSDLITNHLNGLEGVDPYEASSRLTSLMTQMETAYSMTARLQKMSLLNYLTP